MLVQVEWRARRGVTAKDVVRTYIGKIGTRAQPARGSSRRQREFGASRWKAA